MLIILPPARPDQPTNKHFWHTEYADVDAQVVFDMWTSIPDWPLFDTGLEAAALKDGRDKIIEVGQKGILIAEGGRKVKFEITAYDPGTHSYSFTSQLILAKLHIYRFAKADTSGQLAITHEVWFSGPLGSLFAGILGKKFRAQLPAVVKRVVRMSAERSKKLK